MNVGSIAAAVGADALRRATVVRVEGDGTVVVGGSPGDEEVLCELLRTAGALHLRLAPRDEVLCWQPDPRVARGVVLGRIGLSHAEDETPDEIVLEARHAVILRTGEGSISIREDGKVLIKGKDLVSHAQRMNRIKGGAVAIN